MFRGGGGGGGVGGVYGVYWYNNKDKVWGRHLPLQKNMEELQTNKHLELQTCCSAALAPTQELSSRYCSCYC